MHSRKLVVRVIVELFLVIPELFIELIFSEFQRFVADIESVEQLQRFLEQQPEQLFVSEFLVEQPEQREFKQFLVTEQQFTDIVEPVQLVEQLRFCRVIRLRI